MFSHFYLPVALAHTAKPSLLLVGKEHIVALLVFFLTPMSVLPVKSFLAAGYQCVLTGKREWLGPVLLIVIHVTVAGLLPLFNRTEHLGSTVLLQMSRTRLF